MEEVLKTYKNQTLEGKILVIDYHHFENCIIKKCTLVYGGGPYHLAGNTIEECIFDWRDSARRTLYLHQTLFGGAPGIDDQGNIKMG